MRKTLEQFNPAPIERVPGSNPAAWNVTVEINGVEVEVMGGQEIGPYMQQLRNGKTTKIGVGGVQVPCFTLEAEAHAYTETGRESKAEKIRAFLENK